MKTVTMINEKGGCGKSVTTLTLGCGLASRGYRVVIIDADEQGQVAVGLGLKREPGLFELLRRSKSWKDVLRPIAPEKFMPPGRALMTAGELLIVPSDEETGSLRFLLSGEPFHLKKRVDELKQAVDFVLIDTPPSGTLMHLLIYTATDYALYPTKLEFLNFAGLRQAGEHLQSANILRKGWNLPEVETLGIVPTMFRKGLTEHETNLRDLEADAGDTVWKPVTESGIWKESFSPVSNYTPPYAYAPRSPAAAQSLYIVDKTLAGVGVANVATA
jgi:chromosome partitioning protein